MSSEDIIWMSEPDSKKIDQQLLAFVRKFAEKDKEDIYEIRYIEIMLKRWDRPYAYVWVNVLDNKRWYDGKNRAFTQYVGIDNRVDRIIIDVKEF